MKLAAAVLAIAACATHAQAELPAAPAPDAGHDLYMKYCALCHGERADGNGRMRLISHNPPPANLRVSVLNDEQKADIIGKGGAAVGRSSVMPAWDGQLNDAEIRQVVAYLRTQVGP